MNDLQTPGCGTPPEELIPTSGRPCLLWIGSTEHAHVGRSHKIASEGLSIGRSDDADLPVRDPGVSRNHARIARDAHGQWILTDEGSRNGTYVNGLRVRSTPLREGDKIQLGTVTALRFSYREELEEREERLQQALEATGVGGWDFDARTGGVALSGGAEALVPSDAGFWSAVHPDDVSRVRETLERAAREARRCEVECRVVGPTGTRWFALRGEPFRGPNGTVRQLAGSLIDVTTRKLAEAEVARQALLFESLLDAVMVLDFQGRIIDWNRRAEQMFGWTKAEAMGHRPDELFAGDDAAELETTIVASISQGGGSIGNEVSLRRRDGAEVMAEVVGVPLKDPTGRHVADIAIYRDVTEKRQMQARLLVADRMAALGTLAAGVAHEINNPLAFVLGNVEFLQRELAKLPDVPGAPELQRALDDARTGSERIRNTVRDLLRLARSRDAELVGDVDVNDAVEFALKVSEPQLRHRARLVKKLSAVPRVAAAESKLGQVILNLVLNAAQAVPEGDVAANEVRVTTRHDAALGAVVIEVGDTGVGISAADQRRIFDPFFTTKPIGVGTGLGLSICHSTVTSLGGEIRVQSAPGKGATFTVLLPAATAVAEPQPTVQEVGVPRARILVVDDEPLVGEVIQRLFGLEHEVMTATRAVDALTLVGAGARFDLVLCDLLMPDMTGMQLHDQIQTQAPEQARRTVFMTGGAYTERARAFAAQRSHHILTKPIDAREIEKVIRELLPEGSTAGRREERRS
jgi:PAS domain S-box-containing protein